MNGVRVRGVRKSFRRVIGKTEVLKGIDLDIAPGEVVGLIGPNGAGKTTLMSSLLGFLRPDAGEISIDGHRADDLSIRRRTGFVPERMNFDRHVTARAFLLYMARLAGIPRPEAPGRVEALLDQLQIAHGAHKRLSQHSRGMLQRIGLCQALVNDPAYVFLDEPASGLDPTGVLLVRDAILQQKGRGAAVLLNSHQLSEVEKVCDRVLFLSNGLVAREERLRHDTTIDVAITLMPGFDTAAVERISGAGAADHVVHATVRSEADIADLVRALVAAGAGVIDVRRRTADLEQLFREGP